MNEKCQYPGCENDGKQKDITDNSSGGAGKYQVRICGTHEGLMRAKDPSVLRWIAEEIKKQRSIQ